MQVSGLQTYNLSKKYSFQSSSRVVLDDFNRVNYRNTTQFFNYDLDWNKLSAYIADKYQNIDKVNVICQGCSDGSEALSVAIMLKEKFGSDADKFFPIIAKDFDKYIISKAKSDYVEMTLPDMCAIDKFTNGNSSKYFEIPEFQKGHESVYAKIKPELKNLIKYQVADFTEDMENIPTQNTILFCRNFWPYMLHKHSLSTVATNLASRLKDNSIAVIGSYDQTYCSARRYLKNAGFRESDILGCIFESNYKSLYDKSE